MEVAGAGRGRLVALANLEASAGQFEALAPALPADAEEALRQTGEAMVALHECLGRAELAGCAREGIVQSVAGVRRVLPRSSLLARLQTWPQGHRGDFEIVDRLLGGSPAISWIRTEGSGLTWLVTARLPAGRGGRPCERRDGNGVRL